MNRSFKSCVFDKYSRVELALTNAIAESYLQGVSTRRIREILLWPHAARPLHQDESRLLSLRSTMQTETLIQYLEIQFTTTEMWYISRHLQKVIDGFMYQ